MYVVFHHTWDKQLVSFNYKIKLNLGEECSQVIQKLDVLLKQLIKNDAAM
jgi:hypothetical protein